MIAGAPFREGNAGNANRGFDIGVGAGVLDLQAEQQLADARASTQAAERKADEAVADFDDPVPSDHESFIAQHNAVRRVRQQAARLNEHGFACRGNVL